MCHCNMKSQIREDLELPSFNIWTKGKILISKMEMFLKNAFFTKTLKNQKHLKASYENIIR